VLFEGGKHDNNAKLRGFGLSSPRLNRLRIAGPNDAAFRPLFCPVFERPASIAIETVSLITNSLQPERSNTSFSRCVDTQ
jgi:hypothetical protein